MAITDRDIERIADKLAEHMKQEAVRNKELLLDILEHTVTGGGRIVDPARARATPCTCFTYGDGKEACWSPGVLGLMTSEKNPEQIAEFCGAGKRYDGSGVRARFEKVKTAVEDAHQKWEKSGGGLREWWDLMAKSLEQHKVSL